VLNRKTAEVAAGVFVALNLVIVLGCSGSETTSPRATATRPSTSSSVASKASSTANMSFTGDGRLTATVTDPSVSCSFPDLDGLGIAVLAELPNSPFLTRVRLHAGKVTVVVSSGTDSDYHERAFEGTGVTSFDAREGAVVDSTLTESAAGAGTKKGTLGTMTAIKGSVNCGDQTPGASTVTITGDTAEGALDAAVLDPVRVECYASPDGDEVVVLGIMQVASMRVLVKLGLTSDGAVTVDETLASGERQYTADGSSTITSTGAHVRADLVEQGSATPPRTLHVEGDLTCGSDAGR
jgi:hypothetical protein